MGQVWEASGNKECAAFSSLPGKSRKKLTHKASQRKVLKRRLQEEISFSKVKGMERAEWELAGLFLMSVSKLSFHSYQKTQESVCPSVAGRLRFIAINCHSINGNGVNTALCVCMEI